MKRKHFSKFRPRLETLECRAVPSSTGARPHFGPEGKITTDFIDNVNDFGDGVTTQSDGKILVVGAAGHDFGVARYNTDGSLDSGFGRGGRVTTNFVGEAPGLGDYDHAWSVAVQADGRIVVAGATAGSAYFTSAFAVARYQPDGSLDTSFGTGGIVTTSVDGEPFGFSEARAVTIQPDGKVVVGGFIIDLNTSDYAVAVARYNSDGSLDATFGNGGTVITDAGGSYEDIRSIALQPDAKILISGERYSGGVGGDFLLVRYNSNGSPDGGFGAGGIVTTNFGFEDWTNAISLLPDGRIMAVGGTISSSFAPANFAVARYLANGTPDGSFGVGGKVVTDFGGSDYGEGLAVFSDGAFVAVGTTLDSGTGDGDFALARFLSNGASDVSFGTGGKLTTDFGFGTDDQAEAGSVLGSDGRIVAAGFAYSPATGTYDFGLARYNPDGSLDSGFNSDGMVGTNFQGSQEDSARAIATQPDGKTVVAGESSGKFALVRYNDNGILDKTFGIGGRLTADIGLMSSARGIALQPDGKIVVAGFAFSTISLTVDFALVRFNADGSLDTSFGTGGKVTTDFANGSDQAAGVALLPNGTIVVAGTSAGNFAVARYLANGDLDTSFDADGRITTDLGGIEVGGSVVVRPDGRIVVAGTSVRPSTFEGDFALVSYTASGQLDAGFGAAGQVITNFGGEDSIGDAVIQPDGKIVVAGGSFDFTTSIQYFALARYHLDGSLDSGFGAGGMVTTNFIPGGAIYADQAAFGVAIQPDEKIVAAGYTVGFTATELIEGFALARYNANGTLDTGFGIAGKVFTDVGVRETAWDVGIRSDGRIVVAGDAIHPINGSFDFAVARYYANGSLDFNPVAPRYASFSSIKRFDGIGHDGRVSSAVPLHHGRQMTTVDHWRDGRLDSQMKHTSAFTSLRKRLALDASGISLHSDFVSLISIEENQSM
jgi:uncharacterized delta-60 repeat protein